MQEMKDSIVFYPLPVMGHLVPMVELAKLFVPHNFDVAIVLVNTPIDLSHFSNFFASISTSFPSISFHQLPPHSVFVDRPYSIVAMSEHMRHNNANLHNFLSSHSKTCNVRALVLDMFCTDALDVSVEFTLPSYFFFCSGAYDLAAFIYLPTLTKIVDKNFDEMGDELLEMPGCPPVPASHLMREVMNKDSDIFKAFIYHFDRLSKADRILVNTLKFIERRPLCALRDGLCTPGRCMPPVYCIGPVVAERHNIGEIGSEEKHECLKWLDLQPRKSVVLLCFGSQGAFKVEQLREIAKGLEASEQRFIWVIRAVLLKEGDATSFEDLTVDPELEELLPSGFLERTKDRGMVVKKWIPQTAVLGHEAIGGFVTHCGWNSILESIVNGVPMIAWPLYSEQRLNKVFLVEEMKLAVEMEGYDKDKVEAREVEHKVRWLMTSEGGKELREIVETTKRAANEAKINGGSSNKAFLEIVAALRC